MIALALALAQEIDEETLRGWTADLAHEEFERREEAQRGLQEAGLAARAVLEEAALDDDLERQTRARTLLYELHVPIPVHGVALWLSSPAPDESPPSLTVRVRNLRRGPFRFRPSELGWGLASAATSALVPPEGTPAEVEIQPSGAWEAVMHPDAWRDVSRRTLVVRLPVGDDRVALSNALVTGPGSTLDYDAARYRSTQRGATWFIDPEEMEWVREHAEAILAEDLRFADSDGGGVRVEWVRPGSFPAARGLQEGDIVTEANRRRIENVEAIPEMVDWLRGDSPQQVYIRLSRAGRAIVLVYRPAPGIDR